MKERKRLTEAQNRFADQRGDCPGLNAAIRGVAKAAYETFDAEIVGISIHRG